MRPPDELYVGLLLGRMVHDCDGTAVGRIEEIHADIEDGRCMIREFVTGTRGTFERLSITTAPYWGLRLLRVPGPSGGGLVPADLLDLSDPSRPRLRCTSGELERVRRERRR